MKTTFNTELELSEIQKQLKKLTAQKVKIEKFIKKPNGQMRSVWAINPPKKEEKKFGKHPTQKPEELLKRIILASTNNDDLILDPFCGSSTTGVMAFLLNRRYIGIDITKEYLDLSIKRYNQLKANLINKQK